MRDVWRTFLDAAIHADGNLDQWKRSILTMSVLRPFDITYVIWGIIPLHLVMWPKCCILIGQSAILAVQLWGDRLHTLSDIARLEPTRMRTARNGRHF